MDAAEDNTLVPVNVAVRRRYDIYNMPHGMDGNGNVVFTVYRFKVPRELLSLFAKWVKTVITKVYEFEYMGNRSLGKLRADRVEEGNVSVIHGSPSYANTDTFICEMMRVDFVELKNTFIAVAENGLETRLWAVNPNAIVFLGSETFHQRSDRCMITKWVPPGYGSGFGPY